MMPVSNHGIPMRPRRVTRDAARDEKARAKAFRIALSSKARAAHWRVAQGSLFRQRGDWFIDLLPDPGWGRGVLVHWRTKPMALDPLFWEIYGRPGHNRLPLSFRANGAVALHPPWSEVGLAHDVTSPDILADRVVAWSEEMLARGGFPFSVEGMLDALAGTPGNCGFKALTICLHILVGDRAEALRACGTEREDATFPLADGGGFAAFDSERGEMTTFTQQARAWLRARS